MALSPGPNQLNDFRTAVPPALVRTEKFSGLQVGDEIFLDVDAEPIQIIGFRVDSDGITQVEYRRVDEIDSPMPVGFVPKHPVMAADYIMSNLASGNFMRKFRNV